MSAFRDEAEAKRIGSTRFMSERISLGNAYLEVDDMISTMHSHMFMKKMYLPWDITEVRHERDILKHAFNKRVN